MKLPVRKCYHAAKVGFFIIFVLAILSLFEQWRGGKRSARAQNFDGEDEFEKEVLEDEAKIIPGLGEGGAAAHLVGEAKRLGEESEKKLAINVYLSDRIAYNRTLKDYRNPACERVVYDAELPSASVILIFHNEPYSVVVRTIWSVLNSVRRNQPWYKKANYVDRETGRTMTLGYAGQDPTSPFIYLKEIILVDDNSTLPELKGKLSHYVRTRLPPDLIRILRLPDRVGVTQARLAGSRVAIGDAMVFLDSHSECVKDWLRPLLQRIKGNRTAVVTPIIDLLEQDTLAYHAGSVLEFEGLMRARIRGARAARGDVLVFLDAHCEVGADWLRPLLQRVRHKRDAVLTPLIDVVDQTTFQLEAAEQFQVGGFTFMGHFTWIDVPEREKRRRASDIAPTWSPTMAGGLFAISRAYYWEVGAYDEQMAGWGGENLEMSFRIWQCGGTLETIPCSRVGHVFRSFHPYGLPPQTDTHGINTARMAEVWMDDYAELFYLHRPDLRNNPRIGDVTHRRVLREKLHCKSFQWFLDNVYKEKFVPVRDVYGFGRFQNPGSGLCLDTLQREGEAAPLGLYGCHARLEATQYLALSLRGELRDEEKCAEVQYSRSSAGEVGDLSRRVLMVTCHGKQRGQKWRYLPSRQLQHAESRLCLTSSGVSGSDALVGKCRSSPQQLWDIDYSELNHFRLRDDREPSEQELRLQRLRGQRRISRSLLSYPEEEAKGTRRRKTHRRKSKKRKRRRSKKNKFILKLLRSRNGSEEHLEADLYCKHRQLFPNNSFVRDLVTILNDKDIKVINNGRMFEHNRVSDLVHSTAPPAPPPAAPHPGFLPLEPKKKRKHKKASIQPLDKLTAPDAADIAATLAAPADTHRQPDGNPPQKKIIIEDFVEVKTGTPITQRTPKKRKRMRPHDSARPTTTRATTRWEGASSLEDAPMLSAAAQRSGEQWPVLEARFRRNNTHARTHADERRDYRLVPTFEKPRESDNEVDADHHGAANGRGSPVKLVMRSNLTFDLGDEFFRWNKRTADDVVNLLGELVIPANTSRQKKPASGETDDDQDAHKVETNRDADDEGKETEYRVESERESHDKGIDSGGEMDVEKEIHRHRSQSDNERETDKGDSGRESDKDDLLTGRGRVRGGDSSGSSDSGGED